MTWLLIPLLPATTAISSEADVRISKFVFLKAVLRDAFAVESEASAVPETVESEPVAVESELMLFEVFVESVLVAVESEMMLFEVFVESVPVAVESEVTLLFVVESELPVLARLLFVVESAEVVAVESEAIEVVITGLVSLATVSICC